MSGPRSARVVELSVEERAALEALTRRTTVAAGLVRRARMVLLADDGMPLDRIARTLGADRTIVRTWIDRYRAGGLAALQDRPRSGRPRTFPPGGRADLAPDGPAHPGGEPPEAVAPARLAPSPHPARRRVRCTRPIGRRSAHPAPGR